VSAPEVISGAIGVAIQRLAETGWAFPHGAPFNGPEAPLHRRCRRRKGRLRPAGCDAFSRATVAQISVGTDRVPWEAIAVRCGQSPGCELGARDRDGVIDSVADSGVFIGIGENLEERVCSPAGVQIDVPGFGAASPAPSQRR
jgi:hypothetical protein